MTLISCPAPFQSFFLSDEIAVIWKKIAASIIVLAIVAGGVYLLFATGGGNSHGDQGGLASPEPRTIVTLTVWGGSAFITGFGLRDVIGRAVAARQRSRLKTATQQSVKH